MRMNRDEQAGPLTERTEPISRSEPSVQSSVIRPDKESSLFSSEPSNNAQRSIELHIEELVLDGFSAGDRYRIGEAIERELTRLFSEQGVPPAITQIGEIARVDGGTLEVPPGSDSETTGAQLAKAIYGGFGQ